MRRLGHLVRSADDRLGRIVFWRLESRLDTSMAEKWDSLAAELTMAGDEEGAQEARERAEGERQRSAAKVPRRARKAP